jgi:hypothetical protein
VLTASLIQSFKVHTQQQQQQLSVLLFQIEQEEKINSFFCRDD